MQVKCGFCGHTQDEKPNSGYGNRLYVIWKCKKCGEWNNN